MWIQVCNVTGEAVDDGTTKFNLLEITEPPLPGQVSMVDVVFIERRYRPQRTEGIPAQLTGNGRR